MILNVQSYSQDKKISGNVFYQKVDLSKNILEPRMDTLPLNEYKIYLLRENKPNSKQKLIYTSKSKSKFEITITQKHLKKYKYLEFYSKKYYQNKIVLVDTLNQHSHDIILDEKPIMVAKPIIYLYPTDSIDASVKLELNGKLKNSYPVYKNGWNLEVYPNGQFLNKDDLRKYNYLFWDGEFSNPQKREPYQSGFYVEKEDYISFLQEKLEKIGLKGAEINDFISYWIPILNENERVFIHFRVNHEVNFYAKVFCAPKPDTEIRVYMEFKPIYKKEMNKLPRQKLVKTTRKGFVLVEWGGANVGVND